MATALAGSAYLFKKAADICDRPALWTQANMTLRIRNLGFLLRLGQRQRFRRLGGQPAEEHRGRERAQQLHQDKDGGIGGATPGKNSSGPTATGDNPTGRKEV